MSALPQKQMEHYLKGAAFKDNRSKQASETFLIYLHFVTVMVITLFPIQWGKYIYEALHCAQTVIIKHGTEQVQF